MKSQRKSAFPQKIFCAALLLMLAACGDDTFEWPHYFSGDEVPPEARAEPRVVPVPAGPIDPTWQRLGDVPSKPKDFTPQPTVDLSKSELDAERAAAQKQGQQYEDQQQ